MQSTGEYYCNSFSCSLPFALFFFHFGILKQVLKWDVEIPRLSTKYSVTFENYLYAKIFKEFYGDSYEHL
jgi:hypothetical protein